MKFNKGEYGDWFIFFWIPRWWPVVFKNVNVDVIWNLVFCFKVGDTWEKGRGFCLIFFLPFLLLQLKYSVFSTVQIGWDFFFSNLATYPLVIFIFSFKQKSPLKRTAATHTQFTFIHEPMPCWLILKCVIFLNVLFLSIDIDDHEEWTFTLQGGIGALFAVFKIVFFLSQKITVKIVVLIRLSSVSEQAII